MRRIKLIEVCDFQGGSQPPKKQWIQEKKEGYVRMLQIRDFTQKEAKIEYIKVKNSTKMCQKDDILIARYGASLGKILTGLSGAYNVAIMRTIPNEKKITKRYLYQYLKSTTFQNHLKNVGYRAAQAGFNKEDLSKISIDLPTLEEQNRIANQLYKLEKLIELNQRQIELLDQLIKSQFVKMFKNCERCNLCDIANITMGQSPVSNTYNDQGEGIPFFQGKADFKDIYVKIRHYCTKPTKIAQEGDVLISVRAPVGDVNITLTECCIGRGLASVRPKEKYSTTWFLFYALKSIQKQIENKGTGSTFKAINKDILYKLQLPKAQIEKQNQFVKIADQINKQKDICEKEIQLLQELLNQLRDQYFRD